MDALRRLSQQGERKLYDIAVDVVRDQQLPVDGRPTPSTAGMPGPPRPPSSVPPAPAPPEPGAPSTPAVDDDEGVDHG